MRGSASLLVSALSLLATTTDAIQLVKKSAPAVVGFPIERNRISNPVERDARRRRRKRQNDDQTVTQELENEKTLYFCNITLGSNSQKLRTHIDTGSSDLWVNAPDATICQRSSDPCEIGGTFDPGDSDSLNLVSRDFNITYVDGSYATGSYVTDTFGIGGITLEDFQFGLGTESTSPQGVLGIGYPLNEVQSARNGKDPYPNLPKALTDAGLIQSMAYSLWLNDLGASTGQIMFGGVNSAKYQGSLQTLPVLSRNGVVAELRIAMTALTLNGGEEEPREMAPSAFPIPTLLDSGSSLSYLPDPVAKEVFDFTSAIYEPNVGAAFVACDLANSDVTFDFSFSGIIISVEMNELVVDPVGAGGSSDSSSARPTFRDGTPACFLGIAPTSGGTPILGDTFLRSAYVVYDLENNEISLAKTNFNTTEDDIHEIGTGKDSVPDATGVPSPVTTANAEGSGGGNLGIPRPTGTNDIITPGASPTEDAAAAALPPSGLLLRVVAGLAGAGMLFPVV